MTEAVLAFDRVIENQVCSLCCKKHGLKVDDCKYRKILRYCDNALHWANKLQHEWHYVRKLPIKEVQ